MADYIKKLLYPLVSSHYEELFDQFDLVDRKPSLANNIIIKTKYNFIFAFILVTFSSCYGILGLEYESKEYIQLNSLFNSPYIFIRQIYPKSMQTQGTVIMGLGALVTAMVCALFIFQPRISNRFRIILNLNGQLSIDSEFISVTESEQIIKFQKRARLAVNVLLATLYLYIVCYCSINVWLNDVYLISVWSSFYWLVLFPFYMFYAVYCKYYFFVVFLNITRLYGPAKHFPGLKRSWPESLNTIHIDKI